MEETQVLGDRGNGDTTPPGRSAWSEGRWAAVVLSTVGLILVFLLQWQAEGIKAAVGFLIGLGVLALILAGMALVAQAILLPLDRAARRVKGRVQFTLIDFLCLFLWVQAPMALIHGLVHDNEAATRWILDIYAWLAVAVLWWFSVQRLSRAGIAQAGRRALMLAFVIPTTVVGMFATVALSLAIAIWLGTLWSGKEPPWPARDTFLGLLGALALVALVVLAAAITRRFVAEAGSPDEQP